MGVWLGVGRKGKSVRPSRAAVVVPRLELKQLRAFSVLRTPPEWPIPEKRQAMERAVEGEHFGLMFQFAQEVSTHAGVNAWIVPGNGFVCVMRASKDLPIAAGCNTTAETLKHGMSVVATDPPLRGHKDKRYLLLGIAPDGAKSATVKIEGGGRVTVPVINNVYAYRAHYMMYAKLVWGCTQGSAC